MSMIADPRISVGQYIFVSLSPEKWSKRSQTGFPLRHRTGSPLSKALNREKQSECFLALPLRCVQFSQTI